MKRNKILCTMLMGSLAAGPLVGCADLPGNAKGQGTVIGGVGGAAAGALIGHHDPLVGALIGGALGAGGGYLIGAQKQKAQNPDRHRDEAVQASHYAEGHPAHTADVIVDSPDQTADLNNDGYVTMDEVVAMRRAGLSDDEMIRRLRATRQVFDLTDNQRDYLRGNGISRRVIDQMLDMNADGAREPDQPAGYRQEGRPLDPGADYRDSGDYRR